MFTPPACRGVRTLAADHDEPLAVGEFAVFDAAVVSNDPDAHLESERAAPPVDHAGRIAVVDP
jgi:hypothetical protein